MSNDKIIERTGYNIDDQFATYFITLTIVGWVDLFTRKECQEILINSIKHCQKEKGLVVNAYALMPSHLHMIARCEEGGIGLSNIIRDLKTYTAKQLIKWIEEGGIESRSEWLKVVFTYHAKYNSNNSNYQIWKQDNQPKLCAHPIFTRQKIAYIHNNPVVSGFVDEPEHYRLSSAAAYIGSDLGPLEVEIIDFGVEEGYVKT